MRPAADGTQAGEAHADSMTLTATAPAVTDSLGLRLSTDPVAAASYRQGVHELLERRPEALLSFARSARHDPRFALACAGVAFASSVAGDGVPRRVLDRARATARVASRRERQHVEVLYAALAGPAALALALAIKHLDEFPDDVVVLSVVGRTVVDTGDPRLIARLRHLVADVLAATRTEER
jgi:hypothetical protein